jgi:hypothetical protein
MCVAKTNSRLTPAPGVCVKPVVQLPTLDISASLTDTEAMTISKATNMVLMEQLFIPLQPAIGITFRPLSSTSLPPSHSFKNEFPHKKRPASDKGPGLFNNFSIATSAVAAAMSLFLGI